jgi:hypothetical protein
LNRTLEYAETAVELVKLAEKNFGALTAVKKLRLGNKTLKMITFELGDKVRLKETVY